MTLRRFKTVALPFCTACLLLAGWMLYHSLTGVRMVGCGAGSRCDSVMGSPWAYVFGSIPVSLPATVSYLLLAICILFLGGEREEDRSLDRILWPMMLLLSGAIVGAALWFCYLQIFVLHAFCKYCSLLHLLGVVLAVLVMVAAPRKNFWFVAGLLAAAVFALAQSRTLPAAAYDTGRTKATLPAFTNGETPVLGGPDTPEELILLFDFQCVHCRRLHQILPDLLGKAGGEYRIRLCPVPLSSTCNPYIPASGIDRFAGSCALTRYALAVWYVRPDAYADYWDYLLGDGDEHAAVAPADAETRARSLIGRDFESAIQDPRIDAYLRKAEELFGRTSYTEKSGVPRLIHGQKWLVPETDQADELLELIRLSL